MSIESKTEQPALTPVGSSVLLGRICVWQTEYAKHLLARVVSVRKILAYAIARTSHYKIGRNLHRGHGPESFFTHHICQSPQVGSINKNRELQPPGLNGFDNVRVDFAKQRPESDCERR